MKPKRTNIMKLSILICTIPNRVGSYLPKLIKEVNDQCVDGVQLLYAGDNKTMSVGEKRNWLLAMAKGEYVVFVDDDDWIDKNYINEILTGIKSGADVICFKVLCKVERKRPKEVVYDIRFKRDRNLPQRYERIPNHIMCIKRDLARQVGFKNRNFGEDADFAKRLKPLLKTQCVIDKVLYYYTFSHKISETQ